MFHPGVNASPADPCAFQVCRLHFHPLGIFRCKAKKLTQATEATKKLPGKIWGSPRKKAGWRWVRNVVARTAVPSLYAGPKPQGTLPLAGLGNVPAVKHELVVLRLCTGGQRGFLEGNPVLSGKGLWLHGSKMTPCLG